MADLRLRINELPEELTPAPIDNIAIDGPSTRRTTLSRVADAVRPYSNEAQARAGLDSASSMTPQRVSQAIETLGGQRFATSQQGNKADTAVQPTLTITAGTGLTGGGTLAANRTIALNSASIASLALADTSVQPARLITAGTGLTGGGSLAANRTIALDSTSIASLAKADTAVQSVNGKSGTAVTLAKGDVGLGNVDNTADLAKPISTATQTALNGKATTAQGAKADTAVQPADLGSAAYQSTAAFATAAQGAKADTAVQPARTVSAGAGLTGGGDLSANRTVALNAASVASLGKADTAVQPARAISAGTGLTGGGDLSADRTLGLSAGVQASLAKADTAIQAPGGVAGQVLTKSSATEGDVSWQTVEGATAVSYAPQALTKGQQGQVIANIGAGSLAGHRNKFHNPSFDIVTRVVTTVTVLPGQSAMVADRWWLTNYANQSCTMSVLSAAVGSSLSPSGGNYLSIYFSAAPTSGYVELLQKIENVETLSGKLVTMTAFIRGADGVAITPFVHQVFGTGGSPSNTTTTDGTNGTFATSTVRRKFSTTLTIPSVEGKTKGTSNNDCLRAGFRFSPRTATAFLFDDLSLVEGDATADENPTSPRDISEERMMCKRFARIVSPGTVARGYSTSVVTFFSPLETPMRATPAVTFVGSGSLTCDNGNDTVSAGSPVLNGYFGSAEGCRLHITGFGGAVSGVIYSLSATSRYILLDAEL